MNSVNLNDRIKVKLTDEGKDLYYHQYDEHNEQAMLLSIEPCYIKPCYPKVDEDGYTTFQLWCFMNIYGKYMGIGLKHHVIEDNEIIFVEEG